MATWVKANIRLPEQLGKVHWRIIENKLPATQYEVRSMISNGQRDLIEWLDESPATPAIPEDGKDLKAWVESQIDDCEKQAELYGKKERIRSRKAAYQEVLNKLKSVSQPIPSSIVRRLEEMNPYNEIWGGLGGTREYQAWKNCCAKLTELLSAQPEIKLEEDINVAMAEGAEFVVTRMVGDDPQPAEQGEEKFYLYDEITNQLEEIASVEDAKTFIRENYIEGNSIHPDFSAFLILKEVGTVETIEENDEVKGIQIKLSNHNQQS